MTPVVVGGIMYVTAPNEVFALDAGSGRQIWHFRRRANAWGLLAGGNANRGVAVSGGRVFLETDNAHVLALDSQTGALVWDTEMADWHENYSASSAPLAVGDLVVAGVSGGEHGANGFVAAYEQETGHEVWRFAPCPSRARPDRRRGAAQASRTAARRRGSRAATIRNSTRSTGRSAIRAASTTATIGKATICILTASSRSIGGRAR